MVKTYDQTGKEDVEAIYNGMGGRNTLQDRILYVLKISQKATYFNKPTTANPKFDHKIDH
jgi:hypothetical protein